MSPVAKAPRRYFIEFNVAMLLYLASVIGRKYAVHQVGDPVLRDLILVSPILPICLATLAVVRFYWRMDEYHKRQLLEALAFSAAVTAVVTASWSFLEDVGFPHLQMIHAMMVMMVSWGVSALYLGWNDAVSDGRAWRTVRVVAVTLLYVALGTAAVALVADWAGRPMPWPVLALVATALFIIRMGFFIFSKKSASC